MQKQREQVNSHIKWSWRHLPRHPPRPASHLSFPFYFLFSEKEKYISNFLDIFLFCFFLCLLHWKLSLTLINIKYPALELSCSFIHSFFSSSSSSSSTTTFPFLFRISIYPTTTRHVYTHQQRRILTRRRRRLRRPFLRRSSAAAAPPPPERVRLGAGNSVATQLGGEQQQLL